MGPDMTTAEPTGEWRMRAVTLTGFQRTLELTRTQLWFKVSSGGGDCVSGGLAGQWADGVLPPGVTLGEATLLTSEFAFKRFYSELPDALSIGSDCTMDGVQFALGREARMTIGDHCYFTNSVLLAELTLVIGNYVIIGWNATLADTDFHPLAPAQRVRDAVACSPLGGGITRPLIPRRAVVVEDDVWIGPNATVLKGVTIGRGALVEPGSVVTRDVPARARVLGNPAQVVGRA
jgi:acetyltransferase-like isoleucine patch superfamily enzyme